MARETKLEYAKGLGVIFMSGSNYWPHTVTTMYKQSKRHHTMCIKEGVTEPLVPGRDLYWLRLGWSTALLNCPVKKPGRHCKLPKRQSEKYITSLIVHYKLSYDQAIVCNNLTILASQL